MEKNSEEPYVNTLYSNDISIVRAKLHTIDYAKQQSYIIEILRFPLAILVVFAHMLPFQQEPFNMRLNSIDIYHFVSELISHHIAHIPVSLYFIISGYYFFTHAQQGWDNRTYWVKLKTRIRSLLIPYLVWNTIYIAAVYVKNYIFIRNGFHVEAGYNDFCNSSLYKLLWEMPVNFPLWFIRDLMVMSLISPLFYLYFRYIKVYGLLFLVALYILGLESDIPGFSSAALFYFGIGVFMKMYGYSILEVTLSYKNIIISGTVIFLGLTLYNLGAPNYEVWRRIFRAFGVLAMFYFGYRISVGSHKLKKIFLMFSSVSFFVYVAHEIYIINWLKGVLYKSFLSNSGWGMLLGYFVAPFICIGILMIIYKLMTRLIPRTLAVITGNRTS
ncbi:TPA: acyltransferase [Elizabethkingia meningoseptica]|uniref:acyltransferase family protein n=1 Tax=Elizabethkingia meningoseptica TaxID=238 RepID=UPI0022F18D52|nr:acyltransferase [Elizabethkingia meningoseptica]EJK5329476.1 acyltransferase [Elizabethkingia meningoseptica]WBS75877.1 acyltransferase [Elizabethkingia meningoseptica]HAY3562824.1 acyltransferase [Elizabethkingia meningoseptica]